MDEVESLILHGQSAVGIFLDIKDAFDNFNIESSTQGMHRKDLPPVNIGWHPHNL